MASYTALPDRPPSRASTSSRASDDKGHGQDFPRQSISRPHRDRADTVTSLAGFDYRANILPLSLSGSGPGEDGLGRAELEHGHGEEHKHVGWMQGTALVVGMQVGSGIFSSPGVVVAEVGSSGASLCVWVISGVLAWTGASSFTELGCAIPLSGGAQAYLGYAFGPLASYLYTWSAVSTLKPGSSAIIALIFGEYVNRMIYHAIHGDAEGSVPEWTFKLTALLAIIAVAILNVVSRTMGTSFSIVITTVKIASLVFVFILGIIVLARDGPGPSLEPAQLFTGTSTNPGNYALALYSGLWAFDGWDQCNFVAGEMHNPQRDLPRTIHGSMTLVIILFFSANISYFVALDPSTVASSNTVALDFGRVTLGKAGAVVFSVLVAISCFGALSNGFYTSARLIYASARDDFLPAAFARLDARRRTPDNAMALQAGLTVFFVCFGGGFRSLLNFFSVASWTFYLLTVLGLIMLRIKEPHLERPYRTLIITPIVFCVVAAFLLLMPIFAAPLEALAACIFILSGVPMYYINLALRRPLDSRAGSDGGWRRVGGVAWSLFARDAADLIPALGRGGRDQRASTGGIGGGEVREPLRRGEHIEMRVAR